MVSARCLRGIVPASGICLYVCNSFNISGLDEATLVKFGKWVEYGRVHALCRTVSNNA